MRQSGIGKKRRPVPFAEDKDLSRQSGRRGRCARGRAAGLVQFPEKRPADKICWPADRPKTSAVISLWSCRTCSRRCRPDAGAVGFLLLCSKSGRSRGPAPAAVRQQGEGPNNSLRSCAGCFPCPRTAPKTAAALLHRGPDFQAKQTHPPTRGADARRKLKTFPLPAGLSAGRSRRWSCRR